MRKLQAFCIRFTLSTLCFFAYISHVSASDADTIMQRICQDQWNKISSITALDSTVQALQSSMQADSSWSDLNYNDHSQTAWIPVTHLDRLLSMANAYTNTNSTFFKNNDLQKSITHALAFWHKAYPTSTNWWFQQISTPQKLGIIMILMRKGEVLLPQDLENQIIVRIESTGGNPKDFTGANKTDVAAHWFYRGCLKNDTSIITYAVSQIYLPLVFTTASEGLQHDYSYLQHAAQLYIGGYGSVLISGVLDIAKYTVGTSYAIAGSQLDLLGSFVRNTYAGSIRGHYFLYNVLGRGLSRVGALNQAGFTANLQAMKQLDPAHADEYDQAIARLNGSQNAGYGLKAGYQHFWRADYSRYISPAYTFDVRTVSTRTCRNENGNKENLKGYFLADGATCLSVDGDEYADIFPVWNWAKIPGVTCPERTNIPLPAEWAIYGTIKFTGGVSDSLYGVTAYALQDNKFNVNTSANKAWFFFGDEVVCLGKGITSTAAENINTTLNQCRLKGSVLASYNHVITTLDTGNHTYNNNLDWVLHDKTGYIFPQKGNIWLSNKNQSGTWYAINNSQTADVVHKDVFSLGLTHGIQPQNAGYAYIVLPNKTQPEMEAYNMNRIQIWANTDSVQVVKHNNLGIVGIVFYKAAAYTGNGIKITVDKPCIMMLKNIDKPDVDLSVVEPTQSINAVNLKVQFPAITGEKELSCTFPVLPDPFAGATKHYVINKNTTNIQTQIQPAQRKVEIYPNPVKKGQDINFQLKTLDKTPIQADIYNLQGAKLLTQQFFSHTFSISTHFLQQGIYVVSFSDAQGTIQTTKIEIE